MISLGQQSRKKKRRISVSHGVQTHIHALTEISLSFVTQSSTNKTHTAEFSDINAKINVHHCSM